MKSYLPSYCTHDSSRVSSCAENNAVILSAGRRGFLGLAGALAVTSLTEPTKVLAMIAPESYTSKGGRITGLYRINFNAPGLSVLRQTNGSVRIGDVPILQALQFRSIVVTNTFSALNEECPHEGTSINLFNPATREFRCALHDSFFGPTGTRLRGPATRNLTSYPVQFTAGNDFLFIDVPGVTSAKLIEQATTGIRTIGPNPASEQLTVEFVVSEPQHIRIALLNIIGQEVMTVVDQQFNVGTHKRIANVASVARGMYFCKLDAESVTDSAKVVLV
jgi:Rieske Fe-S protein